MAQITFTYGLKDKLDFDPEVTREINENYVDYIDRNTGEIIVRVSRMAWREMCRDVSVEDNG